MDSFDVIGSKPAPSVKELKDFAFEVVAEALWPTRCVLCDREGMLVCNVCREKLPVVDQWKACPVCGAPFGRVQCCECNDVSLQTFGYSQLPLDGCRNAYIFTDEVGRIVRCWKDSGEQRLGVWMAQEMAHSVEPSWLRYAPTILPIPATKKAVARRGVDHGHQLARELARQLDLPFAQLLLRPQAQDQRELGRQGRLSNIKGKFAVLPHQMLPQAVIIVDDVCTTGSTLYGAATALKKSGVAHVYGLTFARVS